MHKALDRVFDHICLPYAEGDTAAKKAYRACMQEVILNLIDTLISFDELARLECNKIYSVACPKFPHFPDTISFRHPWSRSMPFDQLIENCFGSHGILSGSNTNITSGYECAILENGEPIKFHKLNNATYVDYLRRQLSAVFGFGSSCYDMSMVDIEFITNASDSCLHPEAQKSKIIQPLMDYVEKHVIPQMERYIAEHPCNGQIDETIADADVKYSNKLINLELIFKYTTTPIQYIISILVAFGHCMAWLIMGWLLGRNELNV